MHRLQQLLARSLACTSVAPSDVTLASLFTPAARALLQREGLGHVAIVEWTTVERRGGLIAQAHSPLEALRRLHSGLESLPDLAQAPAAGTNQIRNALVAPPRFLSRPATAHSSWHAHGGDVWGCAETTHPNWAASLIEQVRCMRESVPATVHRLGGLTCLREPWTGQSKAFRAAGLKVLVHLHDLRPAAARR